MTHVEQQNSFLQDVAKLIQQAEVLGLTISAGEMYRTQEQQDIYLQTGKSKKKHSRHQDRMAIDLNYFEWIGGILTLTYKKEIVQPLGDYWESLNPLNEWGGNWTSFLDTPHFQRNDEI
jgi:hypothetical protein